MKQLIYLLVLTTGITGTAFAQTKSDQVFDLNSSFVNRKFIFDLGKGNKMQVELSNMEDLARFDNLDSLLAVFLEQIEPLKDSLGDELLARRIDYTTDSSGRSKIRIQRFYPKGSSFLIDQGDVSAMKLEQDTINFFGSVKYPGRYTMRNAFQHTRYYRVSFLLNNLSDLGTYVDGSLNNKIATLRDNYRNHWKSRGKKVGFYLEGEASISAKRPHGFIAGDDYISLSASLAIQNYKSYFVPSFSLNAGFVKSNGHFKREVTFSWEPNFFFGPNTHGVFKTYRNDFLSVAFGQEPVVDADAKKESNFQFMMSLGYLVKREGEFMEKNTFRVGAGRVSLFSGKTRLEPVMYFNNFLKGVTPGLRLIQSF